MKKSWLLVLPGIILLVLLLTQCRKKNDDAYRFDFTFITNDHRPFNYQENSLITGLGPEVLKVICKQLNIPFEVKYMPWEEGYPLSLTTDNAVLFSTVLTQDRKDQFKWAGPIASVYWNFYSASSNPIVLNSLEEAKLVGKIGILENYAIEQYLLDQGFTNLVVCSDINDAFTKLLNGELDLFPSDHYTAEAALQSLNSSIYKVSPKLLIKTDLIYFAFNKKIPDDVVADFQEQIDLLKANGTLRSLYQEFMRSSDVPGTLQIYTESYPPLTFRNNFGEITGFGTDIVSEIMKRNDLFTDIKLALWSDGYDLALNNPNFCLFTMDRTPIRDTLFQWVGPIGTNTTWFYTKAGSGITISSLEEAKGLSAVGTVSSWFSEQYLLSLGFTNLVSSVNPKEMADKLMNGEVQACVCSDVTFPDILKSAGYQYSQVIPSYALMSSDYYIAFSKSTPAATVNQWQTTFQAMKLDGTYNFIHQKWFP